MPTVNERLLMAEITRSMRIQGAGNNTARNLRRMLDKAHRDVLERVAGRMERASRIGFDRGPETTRRLQVLERFFRESLGEATKATREFLTGEMVDIGVDEIDYQRFLFDRTLPVKYEMVLPSRSMMRTLATQQPFDGRVLSKHIADWSRTTLSRMNSELRTGLLSGDTVQTMTQRVRRVLSINRAHAEGFARTAINHACTQARSQTFAENSDIISRVRWVATLDTRTCVRCGDLDDRRWRLGRRHPEPPAHINCRCALSPVTKSWRELGFIDGPEVDDSVRASMDGEVPAKLSYKDWIAQSDAKVQREALGTTRYEMYRDGRFQVNEFSNRAGRILTIDELKKREGR